MFRLDIFILWVCTTGSALRVKLFVARKVLALLLTNINVFFFITCLTRLVNLRKTVQHFKQLEMFDITAQVLVQNSTGHKKQSPKGIYSNFLGLSGNLYIMIESNWSSWMLRVDSDGNVRGGGRLISTGLSYIVKRYWCLFIIFAEVWRGGIRAIQSMFFCMKSPGATVRFTIAPNKL